MVRSLLAAGGDVFPLASNVTYKLWAAGDGEARRGRAARLASADAPALKGLWAPGLAAGAFIASPPDFTATLLCDEAMGRINCGLASFDGHIHQCASSSSFVERGSPTICEPATSRMSTPRGNNS